MFMVINHPQRQNNLPEILLFYLNNTRIKQVHKAKYLGLTVNDSLNWNEQYKSFIMHHIWYKEIYHILSSVPSQGYHKQLSGSYC